LREAFWGKSFRDYIVSIRVSLGYWLGIALRIAFGMPQAQGRKGKELNRTTAPYNLNGCQDNEISHCIPSFVRNHRLPVIVFQDIARYRLWVHYIAFHGLERLSRQKRAHMKNSSSILLPVSHMFYTTGPDMFLQVINSRITQKRYEKGLKICEGSREKCGF